MGDHHKKIAIVSDAIYPYNKGGKEKRIYEITRRLVSHGNEVTIYTMQWWHGGKSIIEGGVKLTAISPLYGLYEGPRRSITEAIFFSLHCFKLLKEDFDVIEVDHMPHLVLFSCKIIAIFKRKKMVATWHEVWGREYWKKYLGGLRAWMAYYIEKVSAQLPDLIISVSDHTTNDLREILNTKRPIVTIRNGLDLMEILNIPSASIGADVIFAGRLLSHKNVDILLRAIALLSEKHPDITLWIIGEGPEKDRLRKLSCDLGISKNVSFLGFFEDQNELYRIMQASRVFVLPSTREGFGLAALEANACGMPFITIDHHQNATRELVADQKNGILLDLDENQIAHAIEDLFRTKKDRSFYQSFVRKYDWDQITAQVQSIYAS